MHTLLPRRKISVKNQKLAHRKPGVEIAQEKGIAPEMAGVAIRQKEGEEEIENLHVEVSALLVARTQKKTIIVLC